VAERQTRTLASVVMLVRHALRRRPTAARLGTLAALVAPLLGPGLACADPGKPLWEASIGLFPSTFPAYRGSSDQQYYLLPFPFLVYRGEVFKADRHGLRALLFDSQRVELNISTNAAIPVNSDGDSRRDGMPDLDATVEIGPSLNILLTPPARQDRLQLKLPVRLAVASDFSSVETVGWVFNPHLNLDSPNILHGWNTGFDLGPLFATREYHDYYYRVKPRYARPDRPVYRPSGGYSGTMALASLSRRFDRYWVGAFVRYDYLRGAQFEDSPLVDTDHSLMAGVAVSWFFARSARTVER
jgi:MipA family protein